MSQIHRLCLGTAKAMPWYGIGSVSRPTADEFGEIIERAASCGIRWFDAAAAYADAEAMLLSHLPDLLPATLASLAPHAPVACTKLSPHLIDRGAAFSRCDRWAAVLAHNPAITQLRDNDFAGCLKAAKHEGGCMVGASVYAPDEARAAIDAGLGVLQVPYCILDQRHHEIVAEAKAAGVFVMARQPFLQGILTNCGIGTGRELPQALTNGQAEEIGKFIGICSRFNISRVEACLRFSLASAADVVVFGAGSLSHLQEVIAIAGAEPSPGWPECYAELRETFRDSAIELRSLWAR